MPLSKIVLENYRCFRDRQEIELAPVTVVLGKNNSGKSVLTRAPMVIATGFGTTTTAPLDLDRLEPQPVDGFPDLIFEQSPHGKFFLGFDVDGPRPFQMAATIQHVAENRTAFVSDLTLRASDADVVLAWQPAFHVGDGPYSYEIRSSDRASAIRPVAFQGLCPQADGVPELRDLRGMDLSLGPIRYLSAYRDRPERQHRLPLGTPQRIGQQGQGTLGILAHDQERGGGDLLGMVNERLQLIVPGWRLEEIEAGPLWSTVLTRRGSRVRVNLADAGSGLAQMLPILVQCALDEQRGRNVAAPLQIIEEPEMHLHPAAHAELGDLYLRTAQATGTRFLIETHSETLLLRLRRRIAQEDVPPKTVAVYVVEQHDGASNVRRVRIDDLGNLDESWPEGYFSQDYREVRALAAAQVKRSRHAS
ncbi:DUF3696 domain-containing protein [Micromonospora sp. NPDC005205]|uniref:AAA family ATPase n=1 Tax=Micromonospora sp. NPDC005205 TaxID=3156714 RepID=UPI0033A2D5B4